MSDPNCIGEASKLSLFALNFTCEAASSPEIYNVFSPLIANLAAACNRSVDFPMPGSPPTKIAEAGTSPPPRTLSSSSKSHFVLTNGLSPLFKSPNGMLLPRDFPKLLFFGPCDKPISSEILFHSPQASHLPDHFDVIFPQIVQE